MSGSSWVSRHSWADVSARAGVGKAMLGRGYCTSTSFAHAFHCFQLVSNSDGVGSV